MFCAGQAQGMFSAIPIKVTFVHVPLHIHLIQPLCTHSQGTPPNSSGAFMSELSVQSGDQQCEDKIWKCLTGFPGELCMQQSDTRHCHDHCCIPKVTSRTFSQLPPACYENMWEYVIKMMQEAMESSGQWPMVIMGSCWLHINWESRTIPGWQDPQIMPKDAAPPACWAAWTGMACFHCEVGSSYRPQSICGFFSALEDTLGE